jgi:RND family efflux transporter MFP subunit
MQKVTRTKTQLSMNTWDNCQVRTTRLRRNAASGVLLVLTAVVLAGCHKRQEARLTEATLPSVPVQVVKAEQHRIPATEEVVGTIRAKLRATLEAKVSGRIEKFAVLLGQEVKSGDLVARLDAQEIKARLEQAQAGLEQADRDFKRASALFEQQALTRSEFEAAESRQRVAKGAVAETQAMLGYVEIRAPFDGVVTRKLADVGDLAAPGKPLIDIENPSALQMDADIPEAIAASVKPGAELQVRVDSLGKAIPAVVAEKAPTADPASRTIRVKLDLPNGAPVMPGQFGRLLVPVGEFESLRVPSTALVRRGQLEIVFVAENSTARMHLVKAGKSAADAVEILSGLDAGDAVVTEGAELLRDGQPVTLK